MKIEFTNKEVEQILRDHVTKVIKLSDGQTITDVSLATGYSGRTTVEIERVEPKVPDDDVPFELPPPATATQPKASSEEPL